MKQLLAFCCEVEATSNAADFDTLGFSGWYNSPAESTHGEALVKGGISQILPVLQADLDVRLQCPVEEIMWGGECEAKQCSKSCFPSRGRAHTACRVNAPIRVRVGTSNMNNNTSSANANNTHMAQGGRGLGEGEGGGEILSAWNVIITVPMGCLKQDSICFTPPLPTDKTRAIATIGVGLLETVVFRFRESFWPADRKVFGVPPSAEYAWSGEAFAETEKEESDDDGVDEDAGLVFPLDELFYSFNALSHARGDDSNLLLAYVHGRRAKQLEQMSEEDIARAVVLSLQMIFGNEVVTSPIGCVFHKWGQDPYSRGSYCATSPGTSPQVMQVMATPLCCAQPAGGFKRLTVGSDGSCGSRSCSSSGGSSSSGIGTSDSRRQACLQFAGEGTDFARTGLVQGAYHSGTRAAQHILKCHKP